jgi:hypothetical protein
VQLLLVPLPRRRPRGQLCELRCRLERLGRKLLMRDRTFFHTLPLSNQLAAAGNRTRPSGGSGRPDPPGAGRASNTSLPRKKAIVKREFGRVRATISSSPDGDEVLSPSRRTSRYPGIRGATGDMHEQQRERSLNSAWDQNPPRLARGIEDRRHYGGEQHHGQRNRHQQESGNAVHWSPSCQ